MGSELFCPLKKVGVDRGLSIDGGLWGLLELSFLPPEPSGPGSESVLLR